MRRCVIKKAFVAASLGLAMFVTSPAYAGTDEIVITCQAGSADELVIEGIYTTLPLVERPPELKINEDCIVAWRVIKAAGFIIAAETWTLNSQGYLKDPDTGARIEDPIKAASRLAKMSVIVVIRFECQDIGTCLFE